MGLYQSSEEGESVKDFKGPDPKPMPKKKKNQSITDPDTPKFEKIRKKKK